MSGYLSSKALHLAITNPIDPVPRLIKINGSYCTYQNHHDYAPGYSPCSLELLPLGPKP